MSNDWGYFGDITVAGAEHPVAIPASIFEASGVSDTGGMVRVTLTAKGQMKGLMIDDQLLKSDEKVILEDLIIVAHEDARKKVERLMEEKMKGVTAGLALPPGTKLPF